jgi:AbrB family looped-hinge helix DNA binding protein
MLSTVTDKGQVTLPKAIRDQLGIKPGSRIDFEVLADNTLSARVLTRGSSGLFGLLQKPGEAVRTVEEIEAAIAAAMTGRAKADRIKS